MISPSNVSAAAAEREDENLRFRIFLKNHADPDELDRQFLALHKELFAGYDCCRCGNCCRFLNDDGKCRLQECKPEECKGFPYTDQPHRLESLYSILSAAEVCPVVFEIIERLKELYHFRTRKR